MTTSTNTERKRNSHCSFLSRRHVQEHFSPLNVARSSCFSSLCQKLSRNEFLKIDEKQLWIRGTNTPALLWIDGNKLGFHFFSLQTKHHQTEYQQKQWNRTVQVREGMKITIKLPEKEVASVKATPCVVEYEVIKNTLPDNQTTTSQDNAQDEQSSQFLSSNDLSQDSISAMPETQELMTQKTENLTKHQKEEYIAEGHTSSRKSKRDALINDGKKRNSEQTSQNSPVQGQSQPKDRIPHPASLPAAVTDQAKENILILRSSSQTSLDNGDMNNSRSSGCVSSPAPKLQLPDKSIVMGSPESFVQTETEIQETSFIISKAPNNLERAGNEKTRKNDKEKLGLTTKDAKHPQVTPDRIGQAKKGKTTKTTSTVARSLFPSTGARPLQYKVGVDASSAPIAIPKQKKVSFAPQPCFNAAPSRQNVNKTTTTVARVLFPSTRQHPAGSVRNNIDPSLARRSMQAVVPKPRNRGNCKDVPIPDPVPSSQLNVNDGKRKTTIFFVPLGRQLGPQAIRSKANLAQRLGASVLTIDPNKSDKNYRIHLLKHKITHLVIDPDINVGDVAKYFRVKPSVLAAVVKHSKIVAVLPCWLELDFPDCTELSVPRANQRYIELYWLPSAKRKADGSVLPERCVRAKVRRGDRLIAGNGHESTVVPRRQSFANDLNQELSDMFAKLAKQYQEAPLEEGDTHRAYIFNLVAGRLRYLDFSVKRDPTAIIQLQQIKHFGPSVIQCVREYLKTGEFKRSSMFETSPDRVAMSQLMKIWGVGEKKARNLISRGFNSVAKLRAAVNSGVFQDLSDNQKIGLECYEEFLEKMNREEVEAIGGIIIKEVKRQFPNAEASIMGSYRRGKEKCGDVDVLIADQSYCAYTPRGALGGIVSELFDQGHISHHLTFLEGMECNSRRKRVKSRQTYMGVFWSPIVKGRRRRIDIKFYPYRERAFATLYFTGNGWFNRSMRQWAKHIKKVFLNDHGLFPFDGEKYHVPAPHDKLHLEAQSEQEIFEYLGLVYKAPNERDCFDAVIGRDGTASLEDLDVKERDFNGEDIWVN